MYESVADLKQQVPEHISIMRLTPYFFIENSNYKLFKKIGLWYKNKNKKQAEWLKKRKYTRMHVHRHKDTHRTTHLPAPIHSPTVGYFILSLTNFIAPGRSEQETVSRAVWLNGLKCFSWSIFILGSASPLFKSKKGSSSGYDAPSKQWLLTKLDFSFFFFPMVRRYQLWGSGGYRFIIALIWF